MKQPLLKHNCWFANVNAHTVHMLAPRKCALMMPVLLVKGSDQQNRRGKSEGEMNGRRNAWCEKMMMHVVHTLFFLLGRVLVHTHQPYITQTSRHVSWSKNSDQALKLCCFTGHPVQSSCMHVPNMGKLQCQKKRERDEECACSQPLCLPPSQTMSKQWLLPSPPSFLLVLVLVVWVLVGVFMSAGNKHFGQQCGTTREEKNQN
eukprot:TRINITY_DN66636_c11_g5_i1.p1 TRINITY_DN66636_c11_g5~~TRINITY_DN66636_c11_g5_i1.p1  ORF type:complete len:204 (+),score=10.62 TRINITY_DN66636_c11_g5_i1:296-907(+)